MYAQWASDHEAHGFLSQGHYKVVIMSAVNSAWQCILIAVSSASWLRMGYPTAFHISSSVSKWGPWMQESSEGFHWEGRRRACQHSPSATHKGL